MQCILSADVFYKLCPHFECQHVSLSVVDVNRGLPRSIVRAIVCAFYFIQLE